MRPAGDLSPFLTRSIYSRRPLGTSDVQATPTMQKQLFRQLGCGFESLGTSDGTVVPQSL